MMMNKSENDMIDGLFLEVRAQSPAVTDDLMARVLADAADLLVLPIVTSKRNHWFTFMELIGGWPSMGGLAIACVTGIWIGVEPPASVVTLTADLIGSPIFIDLLSDTSDYFAESFTDG